MSIFRINFCQRVYHELLDGKTWFQSHIVEQLNSYTMGLESWESIQENQNMPLLCKALVRALADSMHKKFTAHGCIWVMGLEREESRRVALYIYWSLSVVVGVKYVLDRIRMKDRKNACTGMWHRMHFLCL